jgi:hypothetical protein
VDTEDDYLRATELWEKLSEEDGLSGEAIIAAAERL